MNVENGKFKIITPTEGMWLCNKKAKTFSQKVYMALETNHSQWEEISETEKIKLEAEWETEELVDDSDYAEAGRILMGVSE